MVYFLAVGSERHGPFPKEQLLSQGLTPQSLVWADGMPQWVRADTVADLASLFPAQSAPPPPPPPGSFYANSQPIGYGVAPHPADIERQRANNTRMAAGICGILLNSLGVHKFIYGATGAGLTMLLVTLLTCGLGGIVMGVIGIIEGIIYLTKTDEEFYQIYMIGKKAWF